MPHGISTSTISTYDNDHWDYSSPNTFDSRASIIDNDFNLGILIVPALPSIPVGVSHSSSLIGPRKKNCRLKIVIEIYFLKIEKLAGCKDGK